VLSAAGVLFNVLGNATLPLRYKGVSSIRCCLRRGVHAAVRV
jgi:hypothetical protein